MKNNDSKTPDNSKPRPDLTLLPEKSIEEIALDGLDGCTIGCLWLRLEVRLALEYEQSKRLSNSLKIDKQQQELIRKQLNELISKPGLRRILVTRLLQEAQNRKRIQFVKLSSPRKLPAIYDRFEAHEADEEKIGCALGCAPDEQLEISQETLEYTPIKTVNGERGSCSDKNRTLMETKTLNASDLLEMNQHEVIVVASEDVRIQYLAQGNERARSAINQLSDMEYIMFEYITRARFQGCIQAFLNKYIFSEQDSHINYQIKSLMRHNLVTKQNYAYQTMMKTTSGEGARYERSVSQILLLHTKFHREIRNKQDVLSHKLLNYLKEHKNQPKQFTMDELRDVSGLNKYAFKKTYEYMVKIGVAEFENLRKDGKRANSLKQRRLVYVKDLPPSIITEPEKQWEMDEENLRALEFITKYRNELIDPVEPTRNLLNKRYLEIGLKGVPIESTSIIEHAARIFLGLKRQFFGTKATATISIRDMMSLYNIGQLEARHIIEKTLTKEREGNILEKKKRERDRTREHVYCISPEVNQLCLANVDYTDDWRDFSKLPTGRDLPVKVEPEMEPGSNTLMTKRKSERLDILKGYFNQAKHVRSYEPVRKYVQAFDKENGVKTSIDKRTVGRLIDTLVETGFLKKTNIEVEFDGKIKLEEVTYVSTISGTDLDDIITSTKANMRSYMSNKTDLADYSENTGTVGPKTVGLSMFDLMMKTDDNEQNYQKHSKIMNMIKTAESEVIEIEDDAKTCRPAYNKKVDHRATAESTSLSPRRKIDEKMRKNKLSTCFPRTGQNIYGFKGKFERAKLVHMITWRMMYGKCHTDGAPIDEKSLELKEIQPIEYDLLSDYARVPVNYPSHCNRQRGWMTIGDIALYMPVCIFVQIHRVSFEIPGLLQYLNDTEKRLTYVRDLPKEIRILLLEHRRYIQSIYTIAKLLAFMGLVYFDIEKKVTKTMRLEEIVVYVNQRASFLDTKTSTKSWCETDSKINYKRVMFHFTDYNSARQYWKQLRETCIKTPLGMTSERRRQKATKKGKGGNKKKDLIDDYDSQDDSPSRDHSPSDRKPGIDGIHPSKHDSHWVTNRLNDWFENEHLCRKQNVPADDGLTIPGDHRGAGGLDSSIFAHRKSSWLPPESRDQVLDYTVDSISPSMKKHGALHIEERRLMKLVVEKATKKGFGLKHKHDKTVISEDEIEKTNITGNITDLSDVDDVAEIVDSDQNEDSEEERKTIRDGANDLIRMLTSKDESSRSKSPKSPSSPKVTHSKRHHKKISQQDIEREIYRRKEQDRELEEIRNEPPEIKAQREESEKLAMDKLEARKRNHKSRLDHAKNIKHGHRSRFDETEDHIITRLQAANTTLFRIFERFVPALLKDSGDQKNFVFLEVFQEVFAEAVLNESQKFNFPQNFGLDKTFQSLGRRRNVIFGDKNRERKGFRITHDKITTSLLENSEFMTQIYDEAGLDNEAPTKCRFVKLLSRAEQREEMNQFFERTSKRILTEWPIEKENLWDQRARNSMSNTVRAETKYEPRKSIDKSDTLTVFSADTLDEIGGKMVVYYGNQEVILGQSELAEIETHVTKMDLEHGLKHRNIKRIFHFNPVDVDDISLATNYARVHASINIENCVNF